MLLNYCISIGRLLEVLVKHKNTALAYADYYYVDEEGRISGRTKPRALDYRHLLAGNPGNMAFLYTKRAAEYGGAYDTELVGTEDWDMWLRMSEKYLFAYLSEPLYFFREHKKSMTATLQPLIKNSEALTAKKALGRIGGRLNLMHLFPGLTECKTDRIAMGASHLQLGTLLMAAPVHFSYLDMSIQILRVATSQLPSLPSSQINLASALVKKWISTGREDMQLKQAIQMQIEVLHKDKLGKFIESDNVYLACLHSITSFMIGKNTTKMPLYVGEATQAKELKAIPEGAFREQCHDTQQPYLVEASTTEAKARAVEKHAYHIHVGIEAGGCMQGCQGTMSRQGVSMAKAGARCGKICKSPGFPKNGTCSIVESPGTSHPRLDGLSTASQAESRIAWSGTVSVATKYEDGQTASPTKISLRLTGRDLADQGEAAAEAACKRHSLAPETCEVVTSSMRNASSVAVKPSGEDLDHEDSSVKGSQIKLVTAASSAFFAGLRNLVGSAHFWERDLPIVVYDMGLSSEERKEVKSWAMVSLRTINWEKEPPHFQDLYTYAWKPSVIADALSRCEEGILLYQDAGQEIRQPLTDLKSLVEKEGHLFPSAGVPAATTVHPGTLRALHTSADELDDAKVTMALGGSMAIACGANGNDARGVIDSVLECAREESCIAPPGASTSNHAFDQAVLSIQLHQAGFSPSSDWRWMAHDETFYTESLPHRLPLANSEGRFKEVHPGDVILYTRRSEGNRPFVGAVRKKCA